MKTNNAFWLPISFAWLFIVALLCDTSFLAKRLNAQDRKPTLESVKELEQQQKQLAQRFGKLEELFIRMSELEAAANPTRAGLLMQAAKMSKQLATLQRLSVAGDLLSQGQFTRAIQEQEGGRENLKKLLELLQSENRSTRLRDERVRLEEIQKEIRRLEQIQRGQTARTESGQELKQAAGEQKDIKEQLDKVATDLNQGKDENDKQADKDASQDASEDGKQPGGEKKDVDAEPKKPKDGEQKEPKEPSESTPPKDGKSKDGKPRDSKPKDSKQSDGKPSNPLDAKDADSKESQESRDGKPSEQDSSKSSDPSKKKDASKPESREEKARKRVESARKRMQNAQDKLEEQKRDEAVDEQRQAENELREAIEELERILRQLREEEIERSLVDVETRLRKMLDLQRTVREQTEKLANLSGDLKDLTLEIQANKLSIEQSKVVMEGQRALLLLQDEGSSTAFPEALEQVNADAQSVSKKLAEANVSPLTQSIEDEIIGALEEMLESLNQVQKKREDKKKRQPPDQPQQQSNNPENEPLVDSIAELKLLKTLQLRINRRTQSLAKQANNQEDIVGQVADPGLMIELEELAGRQQKIHEVTRDILLKAAKD